MNYVIIGTGAAGIMAAKEIRKLKKDAQITMISADEQVHSRCMPVSYTHLDVYKRQDLHKIKGTGRKVILKR